MKKEFSSNGTPQCGKRLVWRRMQIFTLIELLVVIAMITILQNGLVS